MWPDVCVRSSCGAFDRTDPSLIFDLAGNFTFGDAMRLFGRVENLTNDTGIVSRPPLWCPTSQGQKRFLSA